MLGTEAQEREYVLYGPVFISRSSRSFFSIVGYMISHVQLYQHAGPSSSRHKHDRNVYGRVDKTPVPRCLLNSSPQSGPGGEIGRSRLGPIRLSGTKGACQFCTTAKNIFASPVAPSFFTRTPAPDLHKEKNYSTKKSSKHQPHFTNDDGFDSTTTERLVRRVGGRV